MRTPVPTDHTFCGIHFGYFTRFHQANDSSDGGASAPEPHYFVPPVAFFTNQIVFGASSARERRLTSRLRDFSLAVNHPLRPVLVGRNPILVGTDQAGFSFTEQDGESMNQIVAAALSTHGHALTADQLLRVLPNAQAVPNADIVGVQVSGKKGVLGVRHFTMQLKHSSGKTWMYEMHTDPQDLERTLESAFGTRLVSAELPERRPPGGWMQRYGQAMADKLGPEGFERMLADNERQVGPGHISTVPIRDVLATAYQRAGRNAEAVAVLEANVAESERLFGADHPSNIERRNHLAEAQAAELEGRETEVQRFGGDDRVDPVDGADPAEPPTNEAGETGETGEMGETGDGFGATFSERLEAFRRADPKSHFRRPS